MVVHYIRDSESPAPSMVGFIVSKAIGNAVTRNRVKRQLRGAIAEHIQQIPHGSHVVVRALPAAANTPYVRLHTDLDKSLAKVLRGSSTPAGTGSAQ